MDGISRSLGLSLDSYFLQTLAGAYCIARTFVFILIPTATTTLVLGFFGSHIVSNVIDRSQAGVCTIFSISLGELHGLFQPRDHYIVLQSRDTVTDRSTTPLVLGRRARELLPQGSPGAGGPLASRFKLCKRVCPYFNLYASASYDTDLPLLAFTAPARASV
jgi:hypothetical protein